MPRNGTADERRRFVAKRRAARGGDRFEMRAVLGDQRLVGGDDRRAASEQPRDQRARRFDGVERFDDDVVVAAQKCGRIRS